MTLESFFSTSVLMRGLYLFICTLFFQVLAKKPELRDGEDDDDIKADITNRKMAKLYMVSSLVGSSVVFIGQDGAGETCWGGTVCHR